MATHTITLLRHCGASQVYQLEDAMEVRMRVLRADNRAWKMLKWRARLCGVFIFF